MSTMMLLTLTKRAATPSEIAGGVLFFVVVVLFAGLIDIVRAKVRRRAMQRLAESGHLSFTEHTLPPDFPAYHNPYPVKWHDDWAVGLMEGRQDYGKPRNAVSGFRGSQLLVAFDIPVYAKHSARTSVEYVTIVALRSDREGTPLKVPSSLYYSEEGGWRIVQKKKSWPHLTYSLVLKTTYIESLWQALSGNNYLTDNRDSTIDRT